MIIEIPQDVWAAHDDPLTLLALCNIARRECHALITRPAWDEFDDEQPISTWLQKQKGRNGQGTGLTEQISATLREGLLRLPNLDRDGTVHFRITGGASDWARGDLTLADADYLAGRPLKICLEGVADEPEFLKAMALPHHRVGLLRALDECWAESDNAGGIPGIRSRIIALSTPKNRDEWSRRARLWVMYDRDAAADDRSRPGDISQEIAVKLREMAEGSLPWPIPGHQLRRRAIENYVPMTVLRSWWAGDDLARQDRVAALARLPDVVRHQFHMKKGLVGDLSDRVQKAEKQKVAKKPRHVVRDDLQDVMPDVFLDAYFTQLSQRDRQHLCTGFIKDRKSVAHAWRESAVSDTQLAGAASTKIGRDQLEKERGDLLESLLRRL